MLSFIKENRTNLLVLAEAKKYFRIKAQNYIDKMKNKKYHTVGTVPKSNNKIVERCRLSNPNTQMYDFPLSWLGTDTQ